MSTDIADIGDVETIIQPIQSFVQRSVKYEVKHD